MNQKVLEVASKFKKHAVVDVRTGDVVKVSQRIKEGNKERIQIFEGLVIRVKKKGTIANSILVRKLASGVWVEKGFMLHAPSVENVEVVRRQKVRRNYLTYMRDRAGKNTRLQPATKFNKEAVNSLPELKVEEAVEAPATDSAEEETTQE